MHYSASHCDSNALELNNSINHGKITLLNMSIYCPKIHYLTHVLCAVNISIQQPSKILKLYITTLCTPMFGNIMMNDLFHCRPN